MRWQKSLKNSIRRRKFAAAKSPCKKAKTSNRNQTLETEKQKAKALNSLEINGLLRKSDNFLGTFSSDKLGTLVIVSYPCFLVVNTAPSSKKFGHWLAIRIDKSTLEIFDSLGGDPDKWGKSSKKLVEFLHFYGQRKNIFVSPILQNHFSQLCGYFAVYFVLARKYLDFSQILSPFSTDLFLNDTIICDLLLTVL